MFGPYTLTRRERSHLATAQCRSIDQFRRYRMIFQKRSQVTRVQSRLEHQTTTASASGLIPISQSIEMFGPYTLTRRERSHSATAECRSIDQFRRYREPKLFATIRSST